jgi:hypothetical protein
VLAPISSSVLTLFKLGSKGPAADNGNTRTAEAVNKIAELVSTRATPVQKQAITAISNALAGEAKPSVTTKKDDAEPSVTAKNADNEASAQTVSEAERATAMAAAADGINIPRVPSMGGLIEAKQKVDRADQVLNFANSRIEDYSKQLAEAPDEASKAKIQARIDRYKNTIQETTALVKHFDSIVQNFDTKTRATYDVSGDILTKNSDGKYEWGIFTVSNKVTGEMFYQHDGNGTVSMLDGINRPYITQDLP